MSPGSPPSHPRDSAYLTVPSHRARKRVARQRKETQLPLGRLIDVRRAVYGELKSFSNLGSQIGDSRALSSLRFSPDSSLLLTASWTGAAKIWSVPGCKEVRTIKGKLASLHDVCERLVASRSEELTALPLLAAHKERIGGVAWHPQATLSQSRTAVNFATSGADNDIKLWGLEGRVARRHSLQLCLSRRWPASPFIAPD